MNHDIKKNALSDPFRNFISKLGKRLECTTSSAKRKSTRRSPKLCSYGSLEDRKMLAAAAVVVDGTLQVEGDNTTEVLSVRQVDAELIVYAKSGNGLGQNIFRTSAENVDAIVMKGFGGNDQIINRTELPSQIFGGTGNDLVVGGTGSDSLFGGTGNDRLVGDFGSTPTNISTTTLGSDDVLAGGDGNDVIMGVGGDDIINGGSGDDNLFGGSGNDQISGAEGIDKLAGDEGADVLSGNDGDDVIRGDNGNDVLLGGRGDDTLYGGEGNDRLRGNLGTDFVNAGRGDDTLLSSGDAESSDRLIGGHGDDIYHFEGPGEAGLVEFIHSETLAHDTIVETANSGNDTIEYMGAGFKHDPRAMFDHNTNLVFRYDLRLVGAETPSTIENYTDLRNELVSGVDIGDGDTLIEDVVDVLDNDSTGDNTGDDDSLINDVVDILKNDDSDGDVEDDITDLVGDVVKSTDIVFEQDLFFDVVLT